MDATSDQIEQMPIGTTARSQIRPNGGPTDHQRLFVGRLAPASPGDPSVPRSGHPVRLRERRLWRSPIHAPTLTLAASPLSRGCRATLHGVSVVVDGWPGSS